ncbi:hypothetical protein C8A01DRAFT_42016 [Parachaetomium inaequale]|uniref:Zn(2)-C6 fungal-type domain-containing protein n=1 Tax=Parachaetomium inaequale TaxID=2588326 RepID=A0AAN6P4P6_9PEZI|nr:hypothetical protein C8A01DRAFT_42016 [Parachaetomium inaequale]
MLAFDGSQAPDSSATSLSSTNVRKKRIACDTCHFSKVRCTGETSGCQRCLRGRKTCHYSESNMGRAPAGVLARRRKPSFHKALDTMFGPALQQSRQHHDWDSASPSESVSRGELHQHALPSAASLGDRRRSDVTTDDHMSTRDELMSSPSPQQQQQQQKSLLLLDNNTNSDLDSLGFDPLISTFDDIDFYDMGDEPLEIGEWALDPAFPRLSVAQSSSRSSPPASPRHIIQPRQQQQQEQSPSQPPPQTAAQQLSAAPFPLASQGSQDSSSCGLSQAAGTPDPSPADGVQVWATQLEKLSRTLQQSPIPLDGMLRHTSQLLARIREALQPLLYSGAAAPDRDPSPSSATALMLILVCLAQAVALFEQCVPAVLAGRSPGGAGPNAADLSLRLGEFQVDRRAQQALQLHVVGKEVAGLLHVSRLIRQALLRPEWRDVPKRTHDLLLEDVQVRTVTLIYQIKQRRGASRMVVS